MKNMKFFNGDSNVINVILGTLVLILIGSILVLLIYEGDYIEFMICLITLSIAYYIDRKDYKELEEIRKKVKK